MPTIPPHPRIAKPIAKTVHEIAGRIKTLAQRGTPQGHEEADVLSLLLAYHESLRPSWLLGRRRPFSFESADPFASYTSSDLNYFRVAMQALYTLRPHGQRALRVEGAYGLGPEASQKTFSPYTAVFSQLPFINFTPLCLVTRQHGSFYLYPTFILHYADSAYLHEPTIISLRQGQLDCSVLAGCNDPHAASGAVVQIAFASSALTLQFDFSPVAVEVFSLLQKHCNALKLPISSKSILFSMGNAGSRIFHIVDFLHKGIFSLPTLAESLQISLYDAAVSLTEAYHIDWYAIDHHGTPTLKPLTYLEYLRAAIASYSVDQQHPDDDTLFTQLSSEYFTASLLYVRRLFHLANASNTIFPSPENRAEGVLLDLLRIAFSIEGYYPRRDLASIPIMQALFLMLLPNVPLTLRTFKLAYKKWPHAILITLSIFKRQDYLQQFYDTEFFAVRYAALASTKEAADASHALWSIAQLMLSCCELKAQQQSHEMFRLKAQLEINFQAHKIFRGHLPVFFELSKLADPTTSNRLVNALINLPNLEAAIIPPSPQKLPILFFIHSSHKGSLPFMFYEIAFRHAQLPGNTFRLVHHTLNLKAIDLQKLYAAFDQSASGVLVLNVSPAANEFNGHELQAKRELILKHIVGRAPKVIFVTFIGMDSSQRALATDAMRIMLYPPILVYMHATTMRNYTYIFQRIAVFFQVSITRDAIQAFVTRLGKSKLSQNLLLTHPVPMILSMFRRVLLAYAQRQAESLRDPQVDSTDAIIARDILSIKFNNPSL